MNAPLRSLAQELAQEHTPPLRLVIVEDDLDHYKILKRIVSTQFPHLSIVGHCESVQELRTHIAVEKPDILLLDIQVRGGCALEVLATHTERCFDVIVISAQRNFEYAQEAMRLGASYYFPKPYLPEDLLTALHNIIEKRTNATRAAAEILALRQQVHEKATASVPTPNTNKVLHIRDGQNDITVPIANVCYVEADKHHVIIHTIDGKYFRQYIPFSKYIKRLEGHGFVPTHRSYLVSLRHIKKLVPEFVVLCTEGKYEKKIPLSKGNISIIKKEWREFRAE